MTLVALNRKPTSELWLMGSHSVTCHPTQVRLVLDLPTLEGWKTELI